MSGSVRPSATVMKAWIRRFSYVVFLTVWLMVMAFPLFAFLMATRGEVQVGKTQGNHLRAFLLMDQDGEGIGLELTRKSSGERGCFQSGVYYFLWEGDGENATYCQCFDPVTGDLLSSETVSCH